MISKEEVEHIAKLARLELTGNEVEKMQKDLSAILDYFALLKKASRVGKTADTIRGDLSATREDVVISSHDMAGDLIVAAPEKKDGYIKVKAIL